MARLIFILLFFLFGPSVKSQQDYTIKMRMELTGLPKEYASMAEQQITTFIKGNKTRTDIQGLLYNSSVYFDGDSLLMLLEDAMGNRQAFKAAKSELENASQQKDQPKPEVVYTGETKKIAGYLCKKAVVTTQDKEKGTVQITAWLSEEIKSSALPSQGTGNMVDLSALDGQALEMEMSYKLSGQDLKLIMTTESVSRKAIAEGVFIPDTKGYEILSYEEFKKKYAAQPK